MTAQVPFFDVFSEKYPHLNAVEKCSKEYYLRKDLPIFIFTSESSLLNVTI